MRVFACVSLLDWPVADASVEVDEAVEKAKSESNPTGGRFVNGDLVASFDGNNRAPRQYIES